MSDTAAANRKIETGNLKLFFYQSLSGICQRRSVDSSDSSIAYIVNLLCHYARSDQLFDWDQERGYDIQPLALLYGEAIQATNQKHRVSALRRLGDVALFISGMFSASLRRKPIGVDYYINIGGGAYGWLSDNLESRKSVPLNHEVFRELSERFSVFVSILDEFADDSGLRGNKDPISLYKLWSKNSDSQIAGNIKHKRLPINGINSQFVH
jgi:hypothetical protein